ncbi:MAG: hypothetical protein ACJ746_00725 [Bryobacteraceae bacterium]
MAIFRDRLVLTQLILAAVVAGPAFAQAQRPGAEKIIANSVVANQKDFKAAPFYNWKERERTADGTKTSQVTMIGGTPYYRLIAVNGKPLSSAEQAKEQKKQEDAVSQRAAETPGQRRKRIDEFEKDRRRDAEMMAQLSKAFTFTVIGQGKLRGFNVWALKATPCKDYQPPNMEAEVLTGMRGQLWIDQKTFQWVKVVAEVVHPVSIGGFLAQVQPGTRFELEKAPVGDGVWLVSHFAMKSDAKVLHVFNHSSEEEETFFDYQKVKGK